MKARATKRPSTKRETKRGWRDDYRQSKTFKADWEEKIARLRKLGRPYGVDCI